jgi:hypothetical protein
MFPVISRARFPVNRRAGVARPDPLPTQWVLVLKAYLQLARFDLLLARGNFAALYDGVQRYPCRKVIVHPSAIERICRALDFACAVNWKQTLCLQRSAATVCLMKSLGVPARMVIGVQQLPFRAHAWVEVAGRVVSDKPYMREMYQVLDCC